MLGIFQKLDVKISPVLVAVMKLCICDDSLQHSKCSLHCRKLEVWIGEDLQTRH